MANTMCSLCCNLKIVFIVGISNLKSGVVIQCVAVAVYQIRTVCIIFEL